MIGPEYLFVLLALQILAVSLTSSLKENSKKIYRLAYEGGRISDVLGWGPQ